MKKMSPRALESIQAASELLEQRFWDNDPPEIGKAVQRLETNGYSKERTKEKVRNAFLRTLIEDNNKKGLDLERFKMLLNELA